MEKPPGVNNFNAFLLGSSLFDLPQKDNDSFKHLFNGTSKDLIFKVETNLERCQQLWEEFSFKQSVFDLWNLRLAFYNAYQFQPYFLTLSLKEEVLAILPLCYNDEESQYVWFGGNWPEDNKFFTKNNQVIPLLLNLIPGKTTLDCIEPQLGITDQSIFKPDSEKYVLEIDSFGSLDDFLLTLKKKKRYNLKRDLKKIGELKPEFVYDNFNHLEDLFRLNMASFDHMVLVENHSTLSSLKKQEAFRQMIKLAGEYQIRMISIIIGGEIASVDFAVIYKDNYYCFNGGCNTAKFSGLGTVANLKLIEDAINLGKKRMDFLQIVQDEKALSWKLSWKFKPLPLFKFVKK